MMGLIGAGNNPMVGMTVAVAVAVEAASKYFFYLQGFIAYWRSAILSARCTLKQSFT